MATLQELQAELYKMERDSKVAYQKRYELKKQIDKIMIDNILSSGILNKLTWEIQNEQRIGCVDGSWADLTDQERRIINFEDGTDYRVVDVAEGVSLSYDLDDGELWISSSSSEALLKFIQQYNIKADASRLLDKKTSLEEQLNAVNKLLNLFEVK